MELTFVFLPELHFSQALVEMDDKITKEGEQREEMDTLKNPAMRFLLERVVVWLAEKGRTDTDHLVEMVFSSLHCCSQQETIRILNHIATVLFDVDAKSYCTLVTGCFMSLMCRLIIPPEVFALNNQLFLLCWHLSSLLCFLDGSAVGNYSANHTKGRWHDTIFSVFVLLLDLSFSGYSVSCLIAFFDFRG